MPHEPYEPWWPAGISSPALYFALKRHSLMLQLREQALPARHSHPRVWQDPHTSAAAGRANSLLASRGHRQLSVRLPSERTNIAPSDEVQFVAVLSLPCTASPQQAQPAQQGLQQGMQPRPLPPPPPASTQPISAAAVRSAARLLLSLQHQEQLHRQQLAAAWGGSALLVAEAHPAANSCQRPPQWRRDDSGQGYRT
ncbi:hypothetical protein ABPG75_001282 [Micractinium tetrahymenae]